jgi:hypothetical protein
LLRCGKDFCQFAEVLGSGGEEELVACATWTAVPEAPQPEYAFEVCEEHFHLLSELYRDVVLVGLGDIAGNLAGVFVFFANNLARACIRAALRFGWTSLGGQFQCAIPGGTLSGRATVWI